MDIDWRAVDALHAARHASFVTEDPSWLAAQLRPGLVHNGDVAPSLADTDGLRDDTRPVRFFTDMVEHHAIGGDGETYSQPDRTHPPSPHEQQLTAPSSRYITTRRIPRSAPAPPPAPEPPHL